MPLRELASGMRAILVRVGAQDADSLNLLERLGLAPGDRVEVIESDDKGVRVQVGENRLLLPNGLAEVLLMERLEA